LLKLLLGGEYPDALRLRPEMGADLAGIIDKALFRAPVGRYQTAAAMAADLRAFLDEMGIDDPDAMLARYLKAPNEAGSKLDAEVLQTLLAKGAAAAKAGDVSRAQAVLSRVLAIDDGNERALKLLGSLGRRRNTRVAAVAAVLVLAVAASSYAAWFFLHGEAQSIQITADETNQRAVAEPEEAPIDGEALREASTETRAEPDTPPADSAESESGTDSVANGKRWVVFRPTPPNVSISVNGSPLKAFGPDFQRVRLRVGNHTFRFVGAEDCCDERVLRKRIPPGSRDFELPVKLRFKPARLYLKGPAPADAKVQITLPGNRKITGRIREILRIPMSSLQTSAQVQIRAPGYRTHKSVVRLRAGGDLAEHSFTLEREAETP
jgi:hypothetical protein